MGIKNIFNLSNLTLVTALILSAIAAWYSILGLTAIFAAAVIPIIVMGTSLEVAKIVTTVWLHTYWDKVTWIYKLYLFPAVLALAFLTSMGIFGFLSKAHIDQGVPTGDIAAKVAIIDEKIKTQKENIDAARKALEQMNAQVDARLNRGDSENSAERAVVIRRQQAKERSVLQQDIATAQKEIAKLNEERAPVASQLRQVEAEVGPIKYIAALIYNDNPDQAILERAVRWVIILIVFVFDPLALTLVVASNTSRAWERNNKLAQLEEDKEPPKEEPEYLTKPWVASSVPYSVINSNLKEPESEKSEEEKTEVEVEAVPEVSVVAEPKVIVMPSVEIGEKVDEVNVKSETIVEPVTEVEPVAEVEPAVETIAEPIVEPVVETIAEPIVEPVVETVAGPVKKEKPYKDIGGDYVSYEGKAIHINALKELKPELFMLTADSMHHTKTNFGSEFPKQANEGEVFIRVDALPNKAFKFTNGQWLEINKEKSDNYLYDKSYIQYLISKIDSGEYDVELLSENEKTQIQAFLKSQ